MIKKIIILIAIILIPIGYVNAGKIILKNGRTITSDTIWEESGQIKYNSYGATISIPKSNVEKIINTSAVDTNTEQSKSDTNNFTFDIWRSGMTINEVIRKAERNDIGIGNGQTICHSRKHFNKVVLKYINKTNILCYYDNILGGNANVKMHFTPSTRLLHSIVITWYSQTSESEFIYEVDSIIHGKYGNPMRKKGQRYNYEKEWFVDGRTSIILSKSSSSVRLTYSDTVIEMTGQDEATSDFVEKRKEAIIKDRTKF